MIQDHWPVSAVSAFLSATCKFRVAPLGPSRNAASQQATSLVVSGPTASRTRFVAGLGGAFRISVCVAGLLIFMPGKGSAFDAPVRIEQSLNLNSQCDLVAFVSNQVGGLASARVRRLSGSTQTQAAGGASFFEGGISNAFSAVTAANLQANCSLADVTNLVQQGAAGVYAAATTISFTFDARRTSNGDLYAYRAEISGAVATTVTVSQTLINAAPTVTLGSLSGPDGSGNYTVVATLSENSTDFTASSLTLTNATATVSGSGSSYTIVLTPAADGSVGVSVPKGGFTDSGGLGNWLASNEVAFSSAGVEQTQKVIAQFMQTRASQLLSSQPDLTGFLSGGGQGSFNFVMTSLNGNFDFASQPGTDSGFWTRLSGSWTRENTAKSQYVFGAIGHHFKISPTLLVGGMLEFDYLSQQDEQSTIDGHGWLAGPYAVGRLPDHPLFVEGRLLYGQTSNDISPLGTYTDSFETERFLAQLKISGEVGFEQTVVIPSVNLSYTSDDQEAYVDARGNAIPEQGLELLQGELGVDVRHQLDLPTESASLELIGGLSLIGSSTRGTGNAARVVPEYEGGRAKVTMGANYILPNGGDFLLSAYYDGIGVPDYESHGLQLGFKLAF